MDHEIKNVLDDLQEDMDTAHMALFANQAMILMGLSALLSVSGRGVLAKDLEGQAEETIGLVKTYSDAYNDNPLDIEVTPEGKALAEELADEDLDAILEDFLNDEPEDHTGKTPEEKLLDAIFMRWPKT